MIVDEKKWVSKKYVLCIKNGKLRNFLLYVMDVLRESNWNGIKDFDSLICRK